MSYHSPSLASAYSTPPDMPRRLSLGRMMSQSTALLMFFIGAIILVLAMLILFHENATATKGYELRGLEKERSMLLLEQEVLNMQIADAQSLDRLKNDGQIQNMPTPVQPRYIADVGGTATVQASLPAAGKNARP